MTENGKTTPGEPDPNRPTRHPLSRGGGAAAGFWRRLLPPSNSRRRLDNALRLSSEELDLRMSMDERGEARPPLEAAKRLLGEARKALDEEGNDELGWLMFKASNRLQIYSLTEAEVHARARAILREANEKLSSWRRTTVSDLLPETELIAEMNGDGNIGHDKLAKVVYAAKILDEHHDNGYLRRAIVKTRLKFLAALTVLVLIFWLAAEPPAATLATTAAGAAIGLRLFWGTVSLAGAVGAIISGFISSIQGDGGRSGIPQELQGSTITFARVALGALSALAVTTLLNSGVLNLGNKLGYELALAVAVVSGFSERLLLRAVEAVSK
ncbi:MAG TPA: hypothetical protein VM936_12720 [Pyrinomonadaceae bacterium]|nr:hypothetical protein [Pyrinomonadaceae bacterium]